MPQSRDEWPPKVAAFIAGAGLEFGKALAERADDPLLQDRDFVLELIAEYKEMIRKMAYEQLAAIEADNGM